jgi:hypothetical protein
MLSRLVAWARGPRQPRAHAWAPQATSSARPTSRGLLPKRLRGACARLQQGHHTGPVWRRHLARAPPSPAGPSGARGPSLLCANATQPGRWSSASLAQGAARGRRTPHGTRTGAAASARAGRLGGRRLCTPHGPPRPAIPEPGAGAWPPALAPAQAARGRQGAGGGPAPAPASPGRAPGHSHPVASDGTRAQQHGEATEAPANGALPSRPRGRPSRKRGVVQPRRVGTCTRPSSQPTPLTADCAKPGKAEKKPKHRLSGLCVS